MKKLQELRERGWYERIYKIGVGIKGLDGLVELVAGIWLWVAPNSLHALLTSLMNEAHEHHGKISDFIANNIAHVDQDLVRGGMWIVILFLVGHGIVKLAMVYALLKELLWAYPYALIILAGFLIAQVYAFLTHPSVGMGIFCVLDVIIIYLVWGEWQKLKVEVAHRQNT